MSASQASISARWSRGRVLRIHRRLLAPQWIPGGQLAVEVWVFHEVPDDHMPPGARDPELCDRLRIEGIREPIEETTHLVEILEDRRIAGRIRVPPFDDVLAVLAMDTCSPEELRALGEGSLDIVL